MLTVAKTSKRSSMSTSATVPSCIVELNTAMCRYDGAASLQTIAIVGLGYVGLPTAALLASTGLVNVLGVDICRYRRLDRNVRRFRMGFPVSQVLLLNFPKMFP